MDQLDAAILREMSRGRVLFWGGSDHRLTAPTIADRLGVDRTTVWARLRAWRESGFLVRQDVVPSPCLFGAGIAGGDVRVDDATMKPRVIEALQLVEGVLFGFDQVGPYIVVEYAMESEAGLERCRQLVARIPGVDQASWCFPFQAPRPAIEPDERDWRLVAALRARPDGSLGEVADAAGIPLRTFKRRYAELLEKNALWTYPVLDYDKYDGATLARLVVSLADDAALDPLLAACRAEVPGLVWSLALRELAPDDSMADPWVDLYVHADSVGGVERLKQRLLGRDDVAQVDLYFPRTCFVSSSWYDERLAKQLRDRRTGE